jgi:hypothetical protein
MKLRELSLIETENTFVAWMLNRYIWSDYPTLLRNILLHPKMHLAWTWMTEKHFAATLMHAGIQFLSCI